MSNEAREPGVTDGTPADWALESPGVAQQVYHLVSDRNVLDDAYFSAVLPLLDRQLGRAGLRLARFLNDAYSSNVCPVQ